MTRGKLGCRNVLSFASSGSSWAQGAMQSWISSIYWRNSTI